MSLSTKRSLPGKQNQQNTESEDEIGSNISSKIQIISSYHKDMLKEYISSNTVLDPTSLTKVHHEFLNTFAGTQNIGQLTSKLDENFHDIRERWLLTSMKNINFLVTSLKNKYEDEMEQQLEEVAADKIYLGEARDFHQTLLKTFKTRLEDEITKSIQNEPAQQHVEAFSVQITKIWKQFLKSHPGLESEFHKKQIQADITKDNVLSMNRVLPENSIVLVSVSEDTTAIQPTIVCDGLAKSVSVSQQYIQMANNTLVAKPETPSVSGGLSRRNTVNPEKKKKEERRLHGTVLEALSTVESENTDPEAETNGSSLEGTLLNGVLNDKDDSGTWHIKKLKGNTQSISAIEEENQKCLVGENGTEESLEMTVSEEDESTITWSATTTEKAVESILMACMNANLPNNTIPPTTPDDDTETKTQSSNQTITDDQNKIWPQRSAIVRRAITQSPFDENTVIFYLSPEWMRYRQRISQEDDEVWYRRTIVSSFSDGNWRFGKWDSGKPWSLSKLWDKQDTGCSIAGSALINGNRENITAEYLLLVIMILVRREHKTSANELPSKIIIGVPYWIDSRRRQQILNAADCAGFKNYRIFNENSLSAFHMYTNKKVPKENELIIFSVNSSKLDVSVYRSNDFVTAVLVGNCGIYEKAITDLEIRKSDGSQTPREIKELKLKKALEIAFERADRYDQAPKPCQRSVLICVKDEMARRQQAWLKKVVKRVLKLQDVRVENSASFYGLMDLAASRTFLKNDTCNNMINDGRPFSVNFESNEYCFDTLNFDNNIKHYSLFEEPARVEIPARFRTVFITEVIEPGIKCRLGKLEIKNATTRSAILVDVGYNENGIFMIKNVRGRSSNFDRSLMYSIAFEWVPEDSTDPDKKPWYRSLLKLLEYMARHNMF